MDVVKTSGHWKCHWIIQLITIRRESQTIQNTFSAPPKQGVYKFVFQVDYIGVVYNSCSIVDARPFCIKMSSDLLSPVVLIIFVLCNGVA